MSFISLKPAPTGAGTLLCVAAYNGLSGPFVASLFESRWSDVGLALLEGNCHVDDSRNRLVRDFLVSDAEQLVFLDADVYWQPGDLRRLIDAPADIVAGVYPKRGDHDLEWPVKPLPGDRYSNEHGLVEVEGVPTGFLKIRRCVLERLAADAASFVDREDNSRRRIPIIFERSLNGASRRGGDYEFCRKARAAGFRVYVDPRMRLGHAGVKLWHGCLGDHWRRDVAIPEGLRALKAGTASAETFNELYGAWGNIWAMTPDLLYVADLMARRAKGPILDCGAGLSSLCLAAARPDLPVYALEQSAVWASKVERMAKDHGLRNLTVVLADVIDYGDGMRWYEHYPEQDWGLVVCDGPPSQDGRMGLFRLIVPQCPIIVDDMQRASYRADVERWCEAWGRGFHLMDGTRLFAVIQ